MKVTYYGHSSFLIQVQGKDREYNLVIDPFISPNPNASDIDVADIPADYILVTHGHGDHIADVAAIALNTGATLVSNYEVVNWFSDKHKLAKCHPMNHGGTWDFEFGTLKLTAAVHSSTMPDGSPGGEATGLLINSEEGSFYFAGDTALTMDMKLIGEYDTPDLAFLPLGSNFTMGVRDAAIASEFIRCKQIVGMHYDTFELIQIDHDAAVKEFASRGANLMLMEVGETREFKLKN